MTAAQPALGPSPLSGHLQADNQAFTRFVVGADGAGRQPLRPTLGCPPAAGNVERALARAFLARQGAPPAPAPAPAAPAPAPGPAAPTGDIVQDALAELRASAELLDQNTAQAIDAGSMRVRYLDEVPVDPASDALLEGWGFDKTQYVVQVCPNGEQLVIQRNAQGTAHDGCGTSWLFVSRSVSVARMREILVHETNHAMRLDEGSDEAANSFERYKDEFQAYFIAEFRAVADLDDRARQVREHILRDYPALAARYATDPDFAALVVAHTRPDGNVLNSARWSAVEKASAGLGTDEDALYAAIRSMSPQERAAARADPNFMALVNDELSGDELARAQLLLAGATVLTERALDAMSGLGTDEEALFEALSAMGPPEKATLRGSAAFMDILRDDLSGDELARALAILGGGA